MAVMAVRRWELGEGERRRAPVANGPTVEIVIGAVVELEPGVLATIPVGRRVRLENPCPGRRAVNATPSAGDGSGSRPTALWRHANRAYGGTRIGRYRWR